MLLQKYLKVKINIIFIPENILFLILKDLKLTTEFYYL